MVPAEVVAKQNFLAGKGGTLCRQTFPLSLKAQCNLMNSLGMEI